ncbi:AAA family ATPase [Novosphingobium sp. YJ-S2-02]|uniref:AAA family ATPase n=2 Tax=Novosphingobium aureum TaxID=2792964 RepID=A0A931HBQ0_9SPHN|nr:AAA family ATPase [Novosphingobium aureum]
MGKNENLAHAGRDGTMSATGAILVLAAASWIDVLEASGAGDALLGLSLEPLAPVAPLPEALVARAGILVLEVDPADPRSMDRLSTVREGHPDLPVVAAIGNADLALVRALLRQGVADVVSLPFEVEELTRISLDISARHAGERKLERKAETALAPLVAVTRSIGGSGATSIATQLASDLADHAMQAGEGKGAVIVDLDLQFGNVGAFLGISPRGEIDDLLDAGSRLDEQLLASVASDAGNGLAVIAAPEAIMPLEAVDTDQLLRVIRMLRRRYAYVVLDLPANWTSWTLSAALAADSIVMVVELSVASLRQAKRRLDLFDSVGIDPEAVQVVVNRVEKRLFRTIGVDDVAKTLDHAVLGSVALEAPLVSTAQNQGKLASDLQRKSRFAADVRALGAALRETRLKRGD